MLLYNAPLIRGLATKKEKMLLLDPKVIRDGLELTSHSQFVEFALLLGTDFSTRIHNMGPVRALKGIRESGTVEEVVQTLKSRASNVKLRMSDNLFLQQVRVARTVFTSLPPIPKDLPDILKARDAAAASPSSSIEAVKSVLRRYGLWRILKAEVVEDPVEEETEEDADEWSLQAKMYRQSDLESGVSGGIFGLQVDSEPQQEEVKQVE